VTTISKFFSLTATKSCATVAEGRRLKAMSVCAYSVQGGCFTSSAWSCTCQTFWRGPHVCSCGARYYWPRLFADVAHFVRSCKKCAAAKSSNQKRMGAESYSAVPIQPFTSWAMDLIEPLPMTKLRHEWIVTWVDRTSKTIVVAPARIDKTSAEDIAALTFKESCTLDV